MAQQIAEARKARVCECGSHGFVVLTQGHVALFSPHRLAQIAPKPWSILTTPRIRYARCRNTLMHRVLAGAEGRQVVDHKNHDGLDNRDENLRLCTYSENLRSRRKSRQGRNQFKGVSADKRRWVARIYISERLITIGRFTDPVEAARAYDRAALEMYGEFAMTNATLGLLPPEAAA